MTYAIEPVAELNNICGEGPTWDRARQRVLWTDNETDKVYQLDLKTGKPSLFHQGVPTGGIAINKTGYILAGKTGFHLYRDANDSKTIATEHDGVPLSFNDIAAGPTGGVYAGTMYWGDNGMQQTGSLYLFNPDGTIRIVEEGIQLANGIAFSVDGATMYFADSAARKIYAYDVEPATGDLSNARTFADIPRDDGLVDGITVDGEGFVWAAMWYGGQIIRFDADGKVERRIPMPVKQVSSLIFGGDNYTDLYVTTAGASWPSDMAPDGYDFNAPNIGGSLYRIRMDIQGKPDYIAAFE